MLFRKEELGRRRRACTGTNTVVESQQPTEKWLWKSEHFAQNEKKHLRQIMLGSRDPVHRTHQELVLLREAGCFRGFRGCCQRGKLRSLRWNRFQISSVHIQQDQARTAREGSTSSSPSPRAVQTPLWRTVCHEPLFQFDSGLSASTLTKLHLSDDNLVCLCVDAQLVEKHGWGMHLEVRSLVHTTRRT